MKKLLILAVALSVLCSCAQRFYPWGMTIEEFVKQNHDARFVSGNVHQSVYSRDIFTIGVGTTRKYFYFIEGKLTSIDEGQRVPDVNIQVNHS